MVDVPPSPTVDGSAAREVMAGGWLPAGGVGAGAGAGAGAGDGAGAGVGAGGGGASAPPHANRGITANNIANVIKHTLINVFIIYPLLLKASILKVYLLLIISSIRSLAVRLLVCSLTPGR